MTSFNRMTFLPWLCFDILTTAANRPQMAPAVLSIRRPHARFGTVLLWGRYLTQLFRRSHCADITAYLFDHECIAISQTNVSPGSARVGERRGRRRDVLYGDAATCHIR